MSLPEPLTPGCAEHLAALYRFVFLLTGGDPARADAAWGATLERAASRFCEIRCPHRAAGWLFAEARLQCRRRGAVAAGAPPAGDGKDENAAGPALRLAGAFRALPEPERAALALFYVHRATRQELAEVLGLRTEELGQLLINARALLRAQPALADSLRDPALSAAGN